MTRLPRIHIANLEPEQKTFLNSLTTGKRGSNRTLDDFTYMDGSLKGPFNAWLYSTEIGHHAQKLGEALRFNSAIPAKLREVAILSVAVYWKSQYEWWAHAQIAISEGLPKTVIDSIKKGEPLPETEPGAKAITEFVKETLENKQVADETFKGAINYLGERGIVDLTLLIGYYCLVSASLNVFQVPMPEGTDPPFSE